MNANDGAWRHLVAAKKLPGVQLQLASGLRAAPAQAYTLKEVPTYVLIGEDETFFNFNQNA